MNILRAWKDSLSIFAPKNLKLFGLVTFKSIVDTYKILFRYWWWLYVVLIGLIIILPVPTIIEQLQTNFAVSPQQMLIRNLLHALLGFLILFFTVLAVRPSVQQKNYYYFFKYILIGGLIFVSIIAWSYTYKFIRNLIIHPIIDASITEAVASSKLLFAQQIENYANFFFFLKPQYIYPIVPFFILFLIDLGGRFSKIGSAFIKTIKMTVYNYPLCLVFTGLFYGASYLFALITKYIPNQYSDILWVFVLQMMICVWATIYNKKVHEQSSLYFKES